MAEGADELESNPFYIALQNKYSDLYERALRHRYLLCVPQGGSFLSDGISPDFVATHILRPSPYFKSQYMTTHSSSSRTFVLSEDGKSFTTLQELDNNYTVKVLSEELAYNREYEQYKIIILEQPLDVKFKLKNGQVKEKEKQLHNPRIPAKECIELLYSFSELEGTLDKLNLKLEDFRQHYMVLPDYLDDAVARLGSVSAEVLRTMLSKLKPSLSAVSTFREVLAGALDSYIMNAVYQKVIVVIQQKFRHQDELLASKCHILSKARPEDIGVRKEFSCPLPTAIVKLANLGSLTTPREKLSCLKSTIDNISHGISKFTQEQKKSSAALENFILGDVPDACMTTDDLIPILVMIIARAKCSQLSSDLFYTENFMWETSSRDRDNLGHGSYCLVSFKAAVQYMLQTDFSHLKELNRFLPQETRTGDQKIVASLCSEVQTQARQVTLDSQGQTRLERRISRISDILDQTTLDMSQHILDKNQDAQLQSIFPDRTMKTTPPSSDFPKDTSNQNRQLGDFLSALQDDDLDQPFGKQK